MAPTADVQAILAVLGRRKVHHPSSEKRLLDLRETDLRGANLSGSRLEGLSLQGAHLDRTDATRAQLAKSNLREVDLSGATLTGADLEGGSLVRAKLEGARLNAAKLGDERRARPLVERTTALAGRTGVQSGDGAGDQRVVIGHINSTVRALQ